MSFPRKEYEAFLVKLFDAGATIFWKGSPDPFHTPINGSPIIVKIDVGTAYGYGTSEVRSMWVPDAPAPGGSMLGAYAYYVLQRMTWPLTIDVETYDCDRPGEDFMMTVRNKIRWPSSIQAIQDMGLTTIRVGNVLSMIRQADMNETFGATLEITHGQCYALQTDDDGNVIETIGALVGTLDGAGPTAPNPFIVTMGPFQVGS